MNLSNSKIALLAFTMAVSTAIALPIAMSAEASHDEYMENQRFPVDLTGSTNDGGQSEKWTTLFGGEFALDVIPDPADGKGKDFKLGKNIVGFRGSMTDETGATIDLEIDHCLKKPALCLKLRRTRLKGDQKLAPTAKWYQETMIAGMEDTILLRDLLIVVHNPNQKLPPTIFKLIRCVPVRWKSDYSTDSKSNEETLMVEIGKVEFK